MAKIFKKIYSALERNNKKIMISSSGSTPDGKKEKIRSGQSYLYQTSGMESEIVGIRFHKKVSGSFLNQALMQTMKRYPYLNTKLVELDGDFYIVQNEQSLTTRCTQKLSRLGHISCGYHLIDVTYYDIAIARGIRIECYEVECGTHNQAEFNAKCNKLRSVTQNINIIGRSRDTITRILVPQIERWIKSIGIDTLLYSGVTVTVYSMTDFSRDTPTYSLDFEKEKMVCHFKPEKEDK